MPVRAAVLLVLVLALLVEAGTSAPSAEAHRSGCHTRHVCPSDHATYRWQGLLCVKPTSSKRDATFKRKVVHQGLAYFCKR